MQSPYVILANSWVHSWAIAWEILGGESESRKVFWGGILVRFWGLLGKIPWGNPWGNHAKSLGASKQIPGGFLRAIASGNLAKRWGDHGQFLGSWKYDCLGKSCKVFCKILKIPGGILGRLLGSILWAIVQGFWPGCPAPRPPGCRAAGLPGGILVHSWGRSREIA